MYQTLCFCCCCFTVYLSYRQLVDYVELFVVRQCLDWRKLFFFNLDNLLIANTWGHGYKQSNTPFVRVSFATVTGSISTRKLHRLRQFQGWHCALCTVPRNEACTWQSHGANMDGHTIHNYITTASQGLCLVSWTVLHCTAQHCAVALCGVSHPHPQSSVSGGLSRERYFKDAL